MDTNKSMIGGFRFTWTLLAALLAIAPAARAQNQPAEPAEQDGATKAATEPQEAGAEPAARTLDLSSPQATMQTFLVAIQDAKGDHPERIDDAVRCLDTSALEGEGEERTERVRMLAGRLYIIIDEQGVNLDDIPQEMEGADYVFHQLDVADGPPPEIRLVRNMETQQWLFSASTLRSIPALEEAVVEKAEPPEPVASEVPAARRSPRATMGAFLDAMNAEPPDLDEAILCLDPTGRDPEVWATRGKELAVKLKNVMDKIDPVVLSAVPDAPDGPAYIWYASDTGNIVIEQIEDEPPEEPESPFVPQKGEWRFAARTLTKVDDLFRQFEDKEIVAELREVGITEQLPWRLRLERMMPEWVRAEALSVQVWQWLVLAALLPLGWLVKLITVAVAGPLMRLWLHRRNVEIERTARRRVVRSLGAVVMVLFWFYAVQNLGLTDALHGFLVKFMKIILGVSVVWFGYRCVDIVGGQIAANKEVRLTHFDDVLIPLLRTVLRMFIVLVAVLLVLDLMGYKPMTVLGVLGIGGVALAFAAQDTLGNFFGSITVLFDRPFGIGDWIVIGDIDGTVERVGFRSTRVRTFYNSIITIPNSKMVNTHVDNYGARRYRRAKIMLSVTYSTPPENIEAFCEGIRELVRLHPYTRKDYYHVYFNQFAASSLDILLYVFFEVPDWATELRERHRLFLDILRLAQRLNVEFAFPTQTLWIGRTPEPAVGATPETQAGADTPDTIGIDQAARLYAEVYGTTPGRPGPVRIYTEPRSKTE
jgi:MscS family membrane protein